MNCDVITNSNRRLVIDYQNHCFACREVTVNICNCPFYHSNAHIVLTTGIRCAIEIINDTGNTTVIRSQRGFYGHQCPAPVGGCRANLIRGTSSNYRRLVVFNFHCNRAIAGITIHVSNSKFNHSNPYRIEICSISESIVIIRNRSNAAGIVCNNLVNQDSSTALARIIEYRDVECTRDNLRSSNIFNGYGSVTSAHITPDICNG